MNQTIFFLLVFALSFSTLSCSIEEPEEKLNLEEVEMIYWESQSWESGGGRERLTIWQDGRSEIMLFPQHYYMNKPEMLRALPEWEKKGDANNIYFFRENVFPPELARKKLRLSIESGLHLLRTFKPSYVDGSGTRVGIKTNSGLKEVVIPMFLDNNKGTKNHKRFMAVSKILGHFDRNAYEIIE